MTRVLLVDDDLELSAMLKEYLAQEGFEATTVADGEAGVAEALSGNYAIAVLDVMMPRLNGVDALRRIRQESRMPVLMLTARGDDVDRIVGLELGADDYVPKPCSPRELVARLRAILRRTAMPKPTTDADEFTVGPLRLWPARREAQWAGEALTLTSTEFTLLEVLVAAAGHVVSKNTLSEKALGRPLARFDRSIDVHVSSLRHKLAPRDDGRSWIQTVRGQGYQFVRE
ncbi:MAG: response regulator transcription factor [Denitromonas halophila]|nr:MAG: response regulator transcription factor [Denitromonas halophila]TVT69862.1 MAG: response regulator transcription factor [Denitromonas halophila]